MSILSGLTALLGMNITKKSSIFAIFLITAAGFGACQTMRLHWQSEKHAALLKEHGRLVQERDFIAATLEECHRQASFDSSIISSSREHKNMLEENYSSIRRQIMQLLASPAMPANPDGSANQNSTGTKNIITQALPNTSQQTPKQQKRDDYAQDFKEWSTQPVPDFIHSLLQPPTSIPNTQ